jgi:hypothetical protein
MKHVIRITMMMLLVPMAASAQWEFAGVFPDSTVNTNAHGLTVDNDGKVWVGNYYNTLFEADAERRVLLRVFESDGTEVEFSPLYSSAVGDSTLRFGAITGLNVGADGNIYLATHGFRFSSATGTIAGDAWNTSRSFIHIINPEDGSTVDVVDVTYLRDVNIAHAPNRPSVTEDGFVVLSFVFPASPIVVLDPSDNWAELNRVTDNKLGFSRTLEVNNDGSQIFNPQTDAYEEGGPAGHIQVWEGGVFDEYTVGLPIAQGANPGAIARYPNSNILYFSGAGVGNNPDAVEPWVSSRYYGYSLDSASLLEGSEFEWNYGEATVYQVPRSMAFSPDGLSAYVGSFNNGALSLQKFTRAEPVSIDRGQEIPEGFALEQNYPNPFNPTTAIRYSIGEAGMTTLRVFDMLGRVVATLVNQDMPAGTHNVTFNADQLGSGVYLYELTSGNVRLTNKMTLVK